MREERGANAEDAGGDEQSQAREGAKEVQRGRGGRSGEPADGEGALVRESDRGERDVRGAESGPVHERAEPVGTDESGGKEDRKQNLARHNDQDRDPRTADEEQEEREVQEDPDESDALDYLHVQRFAEPRANIHAATFAAATGSNGLAPA